MTSPRNRSLQAWLLVPLLLIAMSGGRLCWCNGEDHGAQESAENAHDGHGDLAQDRQEHSEHEAPCQDDDCLCTSVDLLVDKASESTLPHSHSGTSLCGSPGATAALALSGSTRAAVREQAPRGNAPPLFVLNCVYRC